jgi:aminopeptidase N
MAKLLLTVFFVILFCCNHLLSQQSSLYIPRDIKQLYNSGTRSYNGKPGPKYWENYADYKINVELVPSTKIIYGKEQITYSNNSPDTLKQIVIRLYQNLYKKGNPRDNFVDSTDLTNGVEIKKLTIGGSEMNLFSGEDNIFYTATNMVITSPEPVLPHSKLEIFVEWNFKMPFKTHIRMGMIDSTSFFVGYWYPQISVYDDLDGWDRTEYSGTQEFYNNFGNFEVNITVPKNFVVWATGVLQNPENVLMPEYLNRMNTAEVSDSVIRIITRGDLINGNVTNSNDKNIWKFKAENVTDFAFSSSDHFLWDGGSVIADKLTKRRTFVSSVYPQMAKDFPEVTAIGMKAIDYYSNVIPGIPFPYPKMTVVNCALAGGMEYPMMVNDYAAATHVRTVGVTTHEIAHTYFPFYMGINERKYAWMDEGWASALPVDLQNELAPAEDQRIKLDSIYKHFAGSEMDMPVMVPSTLLKGASYGVASYTRPSEAYLFLRDMLGDEFFLKALHEYIYRWNGKHPLPYDFFFTFNEASGQNLDWFWKPWFFESGYPDLKIYSVNQSNNKIVVTIEKIGNIPVPVELKIIYSDGSHDSTYTSAIVWKDGADKAVFDFNSNKKISRVELGSSRIPDTFPEDNVYVPKE